MSAKTFVLTHQDEILTATAVAGIGGTVACTAKAVRNIDQLWGIDYPEWCERTGFTDKDIHNRARYEADKAKVCWKEYARVAVPVTVTISSIVLMYRSKKTAAAVLSASLSACQAAYDRLEAGSKDALGPKKFDELQSKIFGSQADEHAEERKELMANPPEQADGAPLQTLIYDASSDRYFYGDIETIRRSVAKFNAELSSGDVNWTTYNDFMEDNGFSGTDLGSCVGWTFNPHEPDESLIHADFIADIKDDEPYIIMKLDPKPLPPYYSI